jgi:hypothetical protein
MPDSIEIQRDRISYQIAASRECCAAAKQSIKQTAWLISEAHNTIMRSKAKLTRHYTNRDISQEHA